MASSNSAPEVLGPSHNPRGSPSANVHPTTFRRITNQEARERREKRLCYYCDEKFALGHRRGGPSTWPAPAAARAGSIGKNGAGSWR